MSTNDRWTMAVNSMTPMGRSITFMVVVSLFVTMPVIVRLQMQGVAISPQSHSMPKITASP
ncbi:MAG TPA: hypothetical protein VI541_03570 [Actinomycetota bacterium]|nr:hypothetical protein [Actinomycetota bacterium]